MGMTIDRELFQEYGITPDHALYPGHPVTIAFCILKAFDNFEQATEKPYGDNTPKAVASRLIPGSGGCVYSALDFLSALRKGAGLEAAFEQADATWCRVDGQKEGGGSYAKDEADRQRFIQRWKDGQAQADLIKPLFKDRESWWLP